MGRATGRRKESLSHEQCLKKVCIIHIEKCKGLQNVSPAIVSLIHDHYRSDLNCHDPNIPKVICQKAHVALKALAAGQEAPTLPAPFDYSDVLVDRVLRSEVDQEHSCLICRLAKQSNFGVKKWRSSKFKLVSRPKLLCGICGGAYGRGLSHQCSPSNLASNLSHQFGSQELEQVASNAIKQKLRKSSGKSAAGGKISLRTKGPQQLPIVVRPPREKARQLTKERLEKLMKDDKLR